MNSAVSIHRNAAGRPRLRGASVRAVFSSLLAGLLAGCAAGPDFKQPAPPDASGYTTTPLPVQTAAAATGLGDAQRFDVGADVGAQWWRGLNSRRLDAWIEQAFLASPTLASAKATLRQAQETYSAQAGSTLYPRVDFFFKQKTAYEIS